MGEVYRARDTRLERTVAIKVLPSSVSSEPTWKLRLEREAKSISRLSHPHICTLHDLGHDSGKDYLVMELVEGETLEQRLAKGSLPPEQAVRIATQIAEALAAAHKHGIVHRDLKPSNVMLTKTGAKLMDFGLAKESAIAPMATVLTEMTAEKAKLTAEGTIVGTFQYMSPEQLEGREVDARADIFSFGALLYEMLTGKPAFSGKSQASLIAAILTADPPAITGLQPMTPPAVDRVVRKCLEKDPEERWQSASDLASELRWMADSGTRPAERGAFGKRKDYLKPAVWLLAVVALLLLVSAIWLWINNNPQPAMMFHAAVPFTVNDVAISADGQNAALVAFSDKTNSYMVWIYRIGGAPPVALEGTQGASYPFWSPDGRSIGFFADGKLKKVDTAKQQVEVLCEAGNGRGGTWNRDGVIIFTPDALSGLYRVSSSGGTATELAKPDPQRQETSLRWPSFLPDGKRYLFLGANFTGNVQQNAIYVGDLSSQVRHKVVFSSANASYVEPGYLLYLRDRTLVVQPFDSKKYVLTGEPHTIAENVLVFPQVFRAVFSAVDQKTLIAQTGMGANLSRMTWFDRAGKAVGVIGEPSWLDNIRLSPDGSKVAADETDQDGRNVDVWIHDVATGSKQRFTFSPALDQTPIWSPNGKQIVFTSNRSDGFRDYRKNSDGTGPEEALFSFENGSQLTSALDWSSDGENILLRKQNQLWYVSLRNLKPRPLIEASWAVRDAQFSPNGHWIAYASNESGKMEIYVVPFPEGNGKWQVSSGGGDEPVWRKDSKELFYISSDGKLTAVPVTAGDRFDASTPIVLFQTHRRRPVSSQDFFSYDLSRDGKRFLIANQSEKSEATPLSVYLNWTRDLEK